MNKGTPYKACLNKYHVSVLFATLFVSMLGFLNVAIAQVLGGGNSPTNIETNGNTVIKTPTDAEIRESQTYWTPERIRAAAAKGNPDSYINDSDISKGLSPLPTVPNNSSEIGRPRNSQSSYVGSKP